MFETLADRRATFARLVSNVFTHSPIPAAEIAGVVRAIKSQTGCMACGYGKHDPEAAQVLELAHRDPATKYRTRFGKPVHIADMVALSGDGSTRYAQGTIGQEISKCDVLCANCHRIADRAGWDSLLALLARADLRARGQQREPRGI